MGHGPDQAAHTHHTEEGEEGLLAPRTGAFSWHHGGILRGDSGEACTACEVLEGKVQPFKMGVSLVSTLKAIHQLSCHSQIIHSMAFH